MINKSLLTLSLVVALGGSLASVSHATVPPTDGAAVVPEMDAGYAAVGLGLAVGLIAFIRDRKRRK